MGASYIEKHVDFVESKEACSFEVFDSMLMKIREVKEIIGESKELGVLDCEKEMLKIARRNPKTWLRE